MRQYIYRLGFTGLGAEYQNNIIQYTVQAVFQSTQVKVFV